MNIGEAGLTLIKSFEGLRLESYPDPATGGRPWTLGYGHTKNVSPGMSVTEEEATEWLRDDMDIAEKCINNSVKGVITQNQFDALCSLIFNIGCGNFRSSTLLRKLNEGEDIAAGDEFLRWDKAAGKKMAGLTRRREAERALFLS